MPLMIFFKSIMWKLWQKYRPVSLDSGFWRKIFLDFNAEKHCDAGGDAYRQIRD